MTPGCSPGSVLHPHEAVDQAVIDDPWHVHEGRPLWRTRFVDTGMWTAAPLQLCECVVSAEHVHVSPLRDDPTLTSRQVVERAREQPAAFGRNPPVPRDYCGVWAGNVWHCVARGAGALYHVDGPWSGHHRQHVSGYHWYIEVGDHRRQRDYGPPPVQEE